MTPPQKFAGAVRGSRGVAGAAATLRQVNGVEIACVRERFEYATKQDAEAAAVVLGMEVRCFFQDEQITMTRQMAHALGFRKVCVVGTDEVTIKQLNGDARINAETLNLLHDRVDDLERHFEVHYFVSVGSHGYYTTSHRSCASTSAMSRPTRWR